MRWIDRLELKLGRYAIPHLLHYVAGFNALAFILYKINPYFFQIIDLYPQRVLQGEIWRLVTYIFIPGICNILPTPDYFNAAVSVMFLIFLGNGLEQVWGAFRLNLFYLFGMIGTTIAAFFFGTAFSNLALNASLFFAFARFYPELVINMFCLIPMKVKWLAWISGTWFMIKFLYLGDDYRAALIAGLANYFLFFGKEIFQEARLRNQAATRRAQFHRQAAMSDDEPLHSCAVCGKTDLSHSDLEFRVGKDGRDYCLEHLPR